MRISFPSSEKKHDKNAHSTPEKDSTLLFLDALCTYFETEQILDKRQIELFRKNWIAEEQEIISKENISEI